MNATFRGQFCVAYSPSGKTIAAGDSGINLYDAATGQELRSFGEDGRAIWSVVFSPDGKALATLGYTSGVKLWDPATGNELAELEGAQKLRELGLPSLPCIAYSPDGKYLAAGGKDGGLWLWDVTTRKKVAIL